MLLGLISWLMLVITRIYRQVPLPFPSMFSLDGLGSKKAQWIRSPMENSISTIFLSFIVKKNYAIDIFPKLPKGIAYRWMGQVGQNSLWVARRCILHSETFKHFSLLGTS